MSVTYRAALGPGQDPKPLVLISFARGIFVIEVDNGLAKLASGKVCGLCGDMDFIHNNDFMGSAKPTLAFLNAITVKPEQPEAYVYFHLRVLGARGK